MALWITRAFWTLFLSTFWTLPVGSQPAVPHDGPTAGVELHFPTALPAPAPAPVVSTGPTQLPAPAAAAGALLLHRFGCITCHTPAAIASGGDLAGSGDKMSAAWLGAWLRDPFDYLPQSRMPRVELAPDEVDAISAFVLSLHRGIDLPEPPAAADPYRGSRLFQKHACGACHSVAGEGGDSGPALDLLGRKTSRQWLYSMLIARLPGPQQHTFRLKSADAADLTAFLARRFAAGDDMPWRLNTPAPDSAAAADGLQKAIARGCFSCHSAAGLEGPPLAWDDLSAADLEAHRRRRGAIPAIALTEAQRQAIVQAAPAPPEPTPLPDDYWHLPVRAHPAPPPAYSEDARALVPEACGSCHVQQWQEWTASRHARALSAGLMGQVVDLVNENPAFVGKCLNCHAPLQEQLEGVQAAPAKATGLSQRGITCSGCHVRQWRVYGPAAPPKRLSASVFSGGQHGGAVPSPGLDASNFCRPCHEDGSMGGFSLQETHSEWAASPQGRRGETCQDCHMPGGDHRFLGIHDRDFVADALNLAIDLQETEVGRLEARIRLHNGGAGHRAPTYATPAIFVKTFLSDADDVVIDHSLQTRVAQRRIALGTNQELFDTRIPAGGDWIFTYKQERPAEARFLNVLVEVDPDHFYREFFGRFGGYGREAEAFIDRARSEIADSAYLLFARQVALP